MNAPLRIGMLGCAAISEAVMFKPASEGVPIRVTALAARDPERAAEYARRWNVPKIYPTYDALLAEADVDAVYIPLANALHHRWVLAALAAGHHVLCEKPIAVNAGQAAEMVAAAEDRGLLLMEAFHWRAHPAARRIETLAKSEAVGAIQHIECWFDLSRSHILVNDIRLSRELGGGCLLDIGGYCVNLLRMIAGNDTTVVAAKTRLLGEVEGAVDAELLLPGGGTASLRVSMDRQRDALSCGARVQGTRGSLSVENPFLPSMNNDPAWSTRLTIEANGETTVEELFDRTSYFHQAHAFHARVRAGNYAPSPARDGVANMRVIDAIRVAAGL